MSETLCRLYVISRGDPISAYLEICLAWVTRLSGQAWWLDTSGLVQVVPVELLVSSGATQIASLAYLDTVD